MDKKLIFAFIGVVLVCIAVGAFFLVSDDDQTTSQPTQTTTSVETDSEDTETDTDQTPEQPTEVVTITYTDDGFSPESYTVTSGTKVVVKNNSSGELQFSSDDHPTHRENSELNLQTIGAGESTEFTPQTAGTWGFHDHLNDNFTGTLLVEQP